jgi:hypothetical protein
MRERRVGDEARVCGPINTPASQVANQRWQPQPGRQHTEQEGQPERAGEGDDEWQVGVHTGVSVQFQSGRDFDEDLVAPVPRQGEGVVVPPPPVAARQA